jgi:hypothetical protein
MLRIICSVLSVSVSLSEDHAKCEADAAADDESGERATCADLDAGP